MDVPDFLMEGNANANFMPGLGSLGNMGSMGGMSSMGGLIPGMNMGLPGMGMLNPPGMQGGLQGLHMGDPWGHDAGAKKRKKEKKKKKHKKHKKDDRYSSSSLVSQTKLFLSI